MSAPSPSPFANGRALGITELRDVVKKARERIARLDPSALYYRLQILAAIDAVDVAAGKLLLGEAPREVGESDDGDQA